MQTLNLHFDDYNESIYLIRFGKKEYLEQIKSGKIRFSRLKKYQNIENEKIGDKYEEIRSIHYIKNGTKAFFKHPYINNGKDIDVTKSILSILNYPDTNIYVSCFSYFNAKNIYESKIFDDEILSENKWDNVLFFLESSIFVKNIMEVLYKYNPVIRKVSYLDYDINQDNLNAFTKSSYFKYQKELRIAINLTDDNCKYINRISEDMIEVSFEKPNSIIIPTKEFRESFIMDN